MHNKRHDREASRVKPMLSLHLQRRRQTGNMKPNGNLQMILDIREGDISTCSERARLL